MFKFCLHAEFISLILFLNKFNYGRFRILKPDNWTTYLTFYYVSYLSLCAVLVFWVARTLRRSGAVFLDDAFRGNEALIRAITHLLDIGFYLVCVGYVLITVRTYVWLQTIDEVFQTEVYKIGFLLLLLGAMHLFNLLLLGLFRRRTSTNPSTAVS